jgi:hypothetical protein
MAGSFILGILGEIREIRNYREYRPSSDAPNTFRDQPTMGQHTRDCLMEAGLGPEDIDRLAAEGAFG